MAVTGHEAVSEAQRNQVPPALRNAVQRASLTTSRIERFPSEHEQAGRGWKVIADTLSVRVLRDELNRAGYNMTIGYVDTTGDRVKLQIRID